VISGRGLIYTVEEVSDLLGIPRPTLYRYLREYSIPHLRKSGKISIPEESFDRIREARDLHKEGLGTESVRRVLREGNGSPDTGEIKERIERLSENLERLKGNGSAADEALSSQAMRTVLARQSLIMSAMFNLTEMVEELLLASGKPRKTVFEEVEGEIREVALPNRTGRLRARRAVPAGSEPGVLPRSSELPAARAERFGSLARRRRRTSLVLLSALLVGAVLLLSLPALGGGELADGLPFLGDRVGESRTGESRTGESRTGESPPSSPNEEQERQTAGGTASEDVAARGAPSAGGERSGTAADARASGGVVETRPGEVPDVSGRDVVEAARTLSGAGYEVAAVQTVKSEEEAGTTVATEPAAGSAAEPGTPVVLVMSGGPTGTETGT
jgi:excisionase family DNA binding protein